MKTEFQSAAKWDGGKEGRYAIHTKAIDDEHLRRAIFPCL